MLNINGETRLVGLIGWPVGHSFSPAMHNSAFDTTGTNLVYVPLPTAQDDLGAVVRALPKMGFVGANVTIPYKEKVIRFMDEMSGDAKLIGAVNTISCVNGILKGDNTDGAGFLSALIEEVHFNFTSAKVIVIGAGGAGRAVSMKVAEQPIASLKITDIDEERGRRLVRDIQKNIPDRLVEFVPKKNSCLEQAIGEANLLVNATPCGMKQKDPCVIQEGLLHRGLTVYDLIYYRLTPLVDKARKRGLTAEQGLSMLLYQAILAFELWTGKKAPVDVMRRALESALSF